MQLLTVVLRYVSFSSSYHYYCWILGDNSKEYPYPPWEKAVCNDVLGKRVFESVVDDRNRIGGGTFLTEFGDCVPINASYECEQAEQFVLQEGEGQTDRHTDRQTNRPTSSQLTRHTNANRRNSLCLKKSRDRQTNELTDRQTNRQTASQSTRQTNANRRSSLFFEKAKEG